VCVCVLGQRLETPLFLAVINRHHFVVKYLSERGATVTGHSAPGTLDPILLHNLQTALQRVCADGQLGLVEQLLSECLRGAALQSLKVRGFITCIYLYECGRLLHASRRTRRRRTIHRLLLHAGMDRLRLLSTSGPITKGSCPPKPRCGPFCLFE